MEFKKVAKLGSMIAKDHAQDMFRLLVNYQSVSASEAASRLGLHIKTAQEFLETLAELEILAKEEVYEKKRPYFRYTMKQHQIDMSLDLSVFIEGGQQSTELNQKIRERKNAGARFTVARGGSTISSVIIWIGKGRERQERRIHLTLAQGTFLYHLPFPSATALSIKQIMAKAGIDSDQVAEILDIVGVLEKYGVIEVEQG